MKSPPTRTTTHRTRVICVGDSLREIPIRRQRRPSRAEPSLPVVKPSNNKLHNELVDSVSIESEVVSPLRSFGQIASRAALRDREILLERRRGALRRGVAIVLGGSLAALASAVSRAPSASSVVEAGAPQAQTVFAQPELEPEPSVLVVEEGSLGPPVQTQPTSF